ncbi:MULTISPECIES: hypothetical protein [Cysteiniphilum]|uniref:hypothetical protein n=1 Tax=Cysteiniphilum TaxID=2056696 RepID=UPI00177BDB13|nr:MULTISPECIES: hypothetical protein [Cysteiniphilum]
MNDKNKIVGVYSCDLEHNILCDENGCFIVAENKKMMIDYINDHHTYDKKKDTIHEITLGEILSDLRIGEVYCFDVESYKTLHPLLANHKISSIKPRDFFGSDGKHSSGMRFIRLRFPVDKINDNKILH